MSFSVSVSLSLIPLFCLFINVANSAYSFIYMMDLNKYVISERNRIFKLLQCRCFELPCMLLKWLKKTIN